MDSFFSVDGLGDLFGGLGSLFGGDYYGYDDYGYYDDYDTSISVDGLDWLFGSDDLFGGLFDDLGSLFGDDGYGYPYDDYVFDDYSYDDYEISGDSSDVIQVVSDLLNGDGDLSGLSEILAGLLGGETSLSVDGELGDLSGLSEILAGLLGGETSLSVDGTSDLLSSLSGLSGLGDILSALTGGTASSGGFDLSALSSILSGLSGGETSLSVDGSTASAGAASILSVLGNLSGLGNLFSGLTGILSGLGSGSDLDGFALLDSLTNLYNGAGISVDGGTASSGATDILSALSGLLGGNGLSSLLGGLISGGTASSGGLSSLSELIASLSGGTVPGSASDQTSSAYSIIGLVNLISETAALNGEQDISSSTGTVIQISDDTWNMMRTTSVLGTILPGEDIFVNSNGTQGIVLSTDTDPLRDALKPYSDYITVNDIAGGLSIMIDDLSGMQKAFTGIKDEIVVPDVKPEPIDMQTSVDLAKTDADSTAMSEIAAPADDAFDAIPLIRADEPAGILTAREEAFQVGLDSLREVGFWLDDASIDMGAQNWDGWDICAIGDFQCDGVDDLLLSHAQTGIMVMLADGDLDKWDSLGQFVTDDASASGLRTAIPAAASGYCMVGDASQWLESGNMSANWIILA